MTSCLLLPSFCN